MPSSDSQERARHIREIARWLIARSIRSRDIMVEDEGRELGKNLITEPRGQLLRTLGFVQFVL